MLKAYLGEFTPSPEIKDTDKLDIFGLDILSKEQLAPYAPSAADIDEFNRAFGVQEQAPVKFSSPPMMEFIGNLIEKYKVEVDMPALRPPGRELRAAYNANEPEYTPAQLNLIKSQRQNPTVRQRTASRPPGRGLRAAYNTDEPEYTPAQLNLIKSQRQNPTER